MSSELATNQIDRNPSAPNGHPNRRSEVRSLMGIQVLSTGSFVPPEVVRNEHLAQLGYDPEWIVQRTGIRARRKLSADQATSDMALAAARECLASVQADTEAVDLVIVATMTPDQPMPSTACLLQQELGIRAAAMDVNAACAGFMYALATAGQFVKSGGARQALVVGADTNTRIVNPSDRKTFPLFGDGAGAVLLGSGAPDQGFLSYTLGADGGGADLLNIPGGGSRAPLTQESMQHGQQFMKMDGRGVFRWAVRLLADTIREVLEHANVALGDVQLVILHQANIRIMEAAAADLGLPIDRLWINLDRYGNTSAGSIPLALDEAHQVGRIERGDKIVLCGFGAGLTWGTAVVEW